MAGLKLSECRNAVRRFAVAMELGLRENDHKGERGWLGDPPRDLAVRVLEESGELLVEASNIAPDATEIDRSRLLSEAADVGNMAMMVADVAGNLALVEVLPEDVIIPPVIPGDAPPLAERVHKLEEWQEATNGANNSIGGHLTLIDDRLDALEKGNERCPFLFQDDDPGTQCHSQRSYGPICPTKNCPSRGGGG